MKGTGFTLCLRTASRAGQKLSLLESQKLVWTVVALFRPIPEIKCNVFLIEGKMFVTLETIRTLLVQVRLREVQQQLSCSLSLGSQH